MLVPSPDFRGSRIGYRCGSQTPTLEHTDRNLAMPVTVPLDRWAIGYSREATENATHLVHGWVAMVVCSREGYLFRLDKGQDLFKQGERSWGFWNKSTYIKI